MKCKFCDGKCQLAGRQKNGTQKLHCKTCKKYQQLNYQYLACRPEVTKLIPVLVCESVSIRGISRVLKIGTTTVIRKIRSIAKSIPKPVLGIRYRAGRLRRTGAGGGMEFLFDYYIPAKLIDKIK
jgi:insertion element IS1 protein InsB